MARDLDDVQVEWDFNTQTFVEAYNPLPSITEKELVKRIDRINKYHNRIPRDEQVFKIEIRFGHGPGKKFFVLQPGEKRTLPTKLADEVLKLGKNYGIAILKPGDDLVEQSLLALENRLTFEQANGSDRYVEKIADLGLTPEQERLQKHKFLNDHCIMEREALIREEMERLETGAVEVEAPAKA